MERLNFIYKEIEHKSSDLQIAKTSTLLFPDFEIGINQ